MNISAPNQASGRLDLIQKLSCDVKQCERMSESSKAEPGSAPETSGQPRSLISSLLQTELAVMGVWKVKHPHTRQQTW